MSSSIKSPQNKQLHSHSEFVCDICYMHFNKSSRIPLIICPRQHQMCSYCILAIRKSRRCPFCRETLDLQNIKINRPLVRKLTNDPNEPNVRQEILQQSNFYISQPSSEAEQNYINEDIFLEIQDEEQFRLHYMVEETERKRKIIYLVTLFFVLPFFILDFYFGFIDVSQPQCTINKKLFGLMNLQSWFVIISILQGSYLLLFILAVLNHKCRRRQFDSFSLNTPEEIYSLGIMIKGLICCVVELFLFFGIMFTGCGGQIYGYGVVLTVIHLLKVAIISLGIIKNACC